MCTHRASEQLISWNGILYCKKNSKPLFIGYFHIKRISYFKVNLKKLKITTITEHYLAEKRGKDFFGS